MKTCMGAFAAPVLMALLSGGAQAQVLRDVKHYPAPMCVTAFPSSSEDLRVDTFGRISNGNTTKSISVVCPIISDQPDERLSDVQIIFFDQNPESSKDVLCNVFVRDLVGNLRAQSGVLRSNKLSTSPADVGTLRITDLPNDGSVEYISCAIPPAFVVNGIPKPSGLVMYLVKEDLASFQN